MPPIESAKPPASSFSANETPTTTQYQVERSADRLHIQFQSDARYLRPVRLAIEEFAREAGFEEKAWTEIGLVVNEAVANVIRHAYHPDVLMPIELTAHRTTGGISIDLRDWGDGQMPVHKPVRNAENGGEIPEPGGLGLICMRSLMDDVTFLPQQPGMLLHMARSIRT